MTTNPVRTAVILALGLMTQGGWARASAQDRPPGADAEPVLVTLSLASGVSEGGAGLGLCLRARHPPPC
jgi:hypothetical protein